MIVKIVLVSVFVGIPLMALLGTVVYTGYLCFKYTKEHKW